MNSSESSKIKKPVNVLVMEGDPELQVLYGQFFNILASRVSFTIVNDISNINISNIGFDRKEPNNSSMMDNYKLDLTQQSIFDVIILDVYAENFRGIEIAKQILKEIPRQRIIITTTCDSVLMREKLDKEKVSSSSLIILQKPFKFSELVSVLSPAKAKFDKLDLTDHVLMTYNTIQEELMDIVDFIKKGIENNALNLLLIRSDMDVTATSILLRSAGLANVDILLEDKSLMILKNEQWYISNGKVDKYRIINQWHELVRQSIQDGKEGLRAFCMMDCFFVNGFIKEVVDYESTLPLQFPIQFIPVCAYKQNDFTSLSESEKKKLIACHNHMILK